MRPNTPSTERRRRGERGQAIVLIAFSLLVIIGFLGLAIDGGRAYWERRILQNGVDAAALAASDSYQTSTSVASSQTAAAREYAANTSIYGTVSTTAVGPGAVDFTWTGSTDTLHMVSNVSGPIATFDLSSTHNLPLAFMSVFGIGPSVKITAAAQGRARTGGTSGYGMVTLSTGNCTGGLDSFSISGGAKITLLAGSVQSNGSAAINAGGTVAVNKGRFNSSCSPVPGGTVTASSGVWSGVAPVVDPALPSGSLTTWTAPQSVNSNVTLNPGIYAADMGGLAGSCHFLSAGVYQANAGFNSTNSYFSNQLRSPDEPAWVAGAPDYNNNVAVPQWWGSCSGGFAVAGVADIASLGTGKWGVMLTSTRVDYYPAQGAGGVAYPRESAPSTCRDINLGAGQGISVTVNNIPGATGYNVYMTYGGSGPPACSTGGPWGYVGNIPNLIVETQVSRGTVSATFNASTILTAPTPLTISAACGGTYALNCAAATGKFGSLNPPGDGAETAPITTGSVPPGAPVSDIPAAGGGDLANEHYCRPAGTVSSLPCFNSTVTPGAVQIYFPTGSCYSFSVTAVMRIFSGIQYDWMAIYAPATNTCTTYIGDSASVVVVGTYYWPGGLFTLNGNVGYLIYFSQTIVNPYSTTGNENLVIAYDVAATAPQGFSQISR